MPPTTSCARLSLLKNVTRCPTVIVISSGDMPAAVIVIVGFPVAAGVPTLAGGVGAAGDEVPLPEHAANAAGTIRKQNGRNTAILPAGGASGSITLSQMRRVLST